MSARAIYPCSKAKSQKGRSIHHERCALTHQQYFSELFEKLTGNPPYPWQRSFFDQIIEGHWSEILNMPTGAGKTALLWIWWLALAWTRSNQIPGFPTRLAWVVDRRVVVDQVTDEAQQLCQTWQEHGDTTLSAPAVSTLRGQLADEGLWLRDPTKPSIIIGTVDMIGSRLLFRGYRSRPYWRPVESGLLGVGTLIVNDESHLTPAFAKLVSTIAGMNPASHFPQHPFRQIRLSATHPDDADEPKKRFQHDPERDASESPHFHAIWSAKKTLELREVAHGQALKAELWKLATAHPASRTIVFLDKPEDALKFFNQLTAKGFAAELLTGTMRGHERDLLVNQPSFQRFQERDPGEQPVFLVATSAGEVGINITCERLITELTHADHLIQRFGRMNRFATDSITNPIDSTAHVVYVEPKKESEQRLQATLRYLRSLRRDVSPKNLWSNPIPQEAWSEQPKTARLEKWRVESWAQTTYPDRDLERVEPWLRGNEQDRDQTEIAWRAELGLLLKWGLQRKDVEAALKAFPILAAERLQEPTSRALEKLKALSTNKTPRIAIVDHDQSVTVADLPDISESDIANKLVLLPEDMGGLGGHGMFDPTAAKRPEIDVAWTDLNNRLRLVYCDEAWKALGVWTGAYPTDTSRPAIVRFAQENGFKAPLILRNPEEESGEAIAFFTKPRTMARQALREIPLDEHQARVATHARELASQAGLGPETAEKFYAAGLAHDAGKDHGLWQRAMGAKTPPAAKTVAPANVGLLDGYRHEFGSLLNSPETDDLALHLIATHHAGGRPFFSSSQFDPERSLQDCERAARSAEQRFGRLQAQYGPWGLAYLEALFKRADGLVSAEEGEGASE